jgi:hypothetical protein
MTNALPAGTRNTSVNLIEEEYREWIAFGGITKLKEMALIGLRAVDSSRAEKIASIRAERMRLKHGIITLLALCIAIQFFAGDPALRGLRRTRRNEAVAVIDVEGEEV